MNLIKLRVVLTLIMAPTILFIPAYSYGGVIFQDDFESYPSNWQCTNSYLSKWSAGYTSCGTTAGFGPEWKMGPGHNSTNAVYAWKHQSVPNGYRSESTKWFSSGSGIASEWYHRWYMKVPSTFNKTGSNWKGTCKLWRYPMGAYAGSGAEIYLNFNGGSSLSNSSMALGSILSPAGWFNLATVSTFNDNLWHAHEIHIKANTPGANNGVIEYWRDGVLLFQQVNANLALVSTDKMQAVGVGMGNCGDGPWDMTTWTAIAFDDVVLSTGYIGPLGAGSSTLSAPTNLR